MEVYSGQCDPGKEEDIIRVDYAYMYMEALFKSRHWHLKSLRGSRSSNIYSIVDYILQAVPGLRRTQLTPNPIFRTLKIVILIRTYNR